MSDKEKEFRTEIYDVLSALVTKMQEEGMDIDRAVELVAEASARLVYNKGYEEGSQHATEDF